MQQELVALSAEAPRLRQRRGDGQWDEAGDAQAAEKVATSYSPECTSRVCGEAPGGTGGRLPLWLFVAPWCAGTAGRAVRRSEVGLCGGERGDGGA
jgi:hypothetical protein